VREDEQGRERKEGRKEGNIERDLENISRSNRATNREAPVSPPLPLSLSLSLALCCSHFLSSFLLRACVRAVLILYLHCCEALSREQTKPLATVMSLKCNICWEELHKEAFLSLSCSHIFCTCARDTIS